MLPNRWGSTGSYRYGFNGKEMDDEVKGQGLQYDYGFRIYDPRLGKFFSQDPLLASFPHYSPYQFAGNSPTMNIDLDGKEQWFILKFLEDKILGTNYLQRFEDGFVEEAEREVVGIIVGIQLQWENLTDSRNYTLSVFHSEENVNWSHEHSPTSMNSMLNQKRGIENELLHIGELTRDVYEYGSPESLGALTFQGVLLILPFDEIFRSGKISRLGTSKPVPPKTPSSAIADVVESVKSSKDIVERSNRIQGLTDPDGGYLSRYEAEGLAFLERETGGAIVASTEKGIDANLVLGKNNSKKVSHFGTGGRSLTTEQFNEWLTGTFASHYEASGVDLYVIDARYLNTQQKAVVKGAINAKGETVSTKSYIIE